jgi:hypothetical protein
LTNRKIGDVKSSAPSFEHLVEREALAAGLSNLDAEPNDPVHEDRDFRPPVVADFTNRSVSFIRIALPSVLNHHPVKRLMYGQQDALIGIRPERLNAGIIRKTKNFSTQNVYQKVNRASAA